MSAPRNTYASYLQIDRLLSAQHVQTGSRDELLFIVIHQSHELWFKLAIHELDCAIDALAPALPGRRRGMSDCVFAQKRLARVSEIQELLIATWGVLRTLTPDEFHVFRDTVGRDGASGFQSLQYRVLEFKLGLKYDQTAFELGDGRTVAKSIYENVDAAGAEVLRQALSGRSIYDAVNVFLSEVYPDHGIADPRHGDHARPYIKQRSVFRCWRGIYEDRDAAPELYQLGEKLIDLEDAFRRWRVNHLSTVSRIIGSNAGTGGSSGLRYLKGVANQLFEKPMFPELWDVRNYMFDKKRFDEDAAGYRA